MQQRWRTKGPSCTKHQSSAESHSQHGCGWNSMGPKTFSVSKARIRFQKFSARLQMPWRRREHPSNRTLQVSTLTILSHWVWWTGIAGVPGYSHPYYIFRLEVNGKVDVHVIACQGRRASDCLQARFVLTNLRNVLDAYGTIHRYEVRMIWWLDWGNEEERGGEGAPFLFCACSIVSNYAYIQQWWYHPMVITLHNRNLSLHGPSQRQNWGRKHTGPQ